MWLCLTSYWNLNPSLDNWIFKDNTYVKKRLKNNYSYCRGQCYWWRQAEYSQKTDDTDNLDPIMLHQVYIAMLFSTVALFLLTIRSCLPCMPFLHTSFTEKLYFFSMAIKWRNKMYRTVGPIPKSNRRIV